MDNSQVIALTELKLPRIQYHFIHQELPKKVHRINPENQEKPHIHDCYEIYVNVAGKVSFLVNNQLYVIEKGDVIVTRPTDVHICITDEPECHEHFCLWFDSSEESLLTDFVRRSDFQCHYRFAWEAKRTLIKLFYDLEEAQNKNIELARTACVFQLLNFLTQQTSEEVHPPHLVLPLKMQQVLDYIQVNYTRIHRVEDIADATFISIPTLNRWFRSYLQLSPHKYVETMKLSYAQKLLLDGSSVTEASSGAGFTDCSRFISVFRKKFGETPLQYQKRRTDL